MSNESAELLRENGLQVTAQRLAVLRAVAGRPHCTADDVAEDVRVEIGTISRQAVYDALSILSEKGIIRRIQPAGSSALYEDRVGDNHQTGRRRQPGNQLTGMGNQIISYKDLILSIVQIHVRKQQAFIHDLAGRVHLTNESRG